MSQILQFQPRATTDSAPVRRSPRLKLVGGDDQQCSARTLADIAKKLEQPLPIEAVPQLFERLQSLIERHWLSPEASTQAAQLLEQLRARDLRFDDAAGRLMRTL